jgi:hypothetical protein
LRKISSYQTKTSSQHFSTQTATSSIHCKLHHLLSNLDSIFKLDTNVNIFDNFIVAEEKHEEQKPTKSKRPRNESINYSDRSLTDDKRAIFKTFKGKGDPPVDLKKQIRLLKNRVSARKCRQKKKSYINNLEAQIKGLKEEVEKHKQINKKEKNLEILIHQLESKEKELGTGNKKKQENCKKEYESIQRSVLSELFKKLICNIMPIDFKLFAQKFLKLNEIEAKDNLDNIIQKLNDNGEMYIIII